MDLSICIVTFNNDDLIEKCLKSIIQYTKNIKYEIIVVDNASSDKTVEIIETQFPEVILIKNNDNVLFTKANNKAYKVAKGKYLLILNSDIYLGDNVFKIMLDYLKKNKEVGALTCAQFTPENKLLNVCAKTSSFLSVLINYTFLGWLLYPVKKNILKNFLYFNWDRKSDKFVEVIPDSCFLVSKRIFEKINFYDEKLSLYFTEDDICKRISELGFKIKYLAGINIFHYVCASTSKNKNLVNKIYYKDILEYILKYYGKIAYYIIYITLNITNIMNKIFNRGIKLK